MDHPDPRQKLPRMLDRAGYKDIAAATDLAAGAQRAARNRGLRPGNVLARRNTVKHNRGTDIFEAGNIRFGLEDAAAAER